VTAQKKSAKTKPATVPAKAGRVVQGEPVLRVPLTRARAHWWRLQGLASPASAPIAEVIAKTGWLRTLGGVEVYLAARARKPKCGRAELDAASEALDVQVVPAVRSCIYLLPRVHVPLALRFADALWRKRTERDLERAGSSWKEVAEVADAVRGALDRPLNTDGLRKALPAGSVRSLGDRGKKVGLSSPLPVALRDLEFSGEVERTLEGGRLDTERYLWRRPKKNPVKGAKLTSTEAELAASIAEIFFSQMGATTTRHFAEWAGLSLTDAKAALAGLPLTPVAVDGYAEDAFVLTSQASDLQKAEADSGKVTLLAFEDNYTTVHGGPALFTEAAHHGMRVESWGMGQATTLGAAKHLSNRGVLAGDRLVGFWEFDPEVGEIVVALLDKVPAATRSKIDAACDALARFLKDELGHARSFTLDTDEMLRKRAQGLRTLAKSRK
jgi:hypothetical protein